MVANHLFEMTLKFSPIILCVGIQSKLPILNIHKQTKTSELKILPIFFF